MEPLHPSLSHKIYSFLFLQFLNERSRIFYFHSKNMSLEKVKKQEYLTVIKQIKKYKYLYMNLLDHY